MGYVALLLLAIVVGGNCLWSKEPGTYWDNLSVTFPKYNGLPESVKEAEDDHWTKIDSCSENAYFRGSRYIKDKDISTMLLFDSNGKIAGIQNGVPKANAIGNFFKKPYWVEDGDMLVVTAYFTKPDGICSGGRKKSYYIGDSLHIQTGSNPQSLMSIPFKEENIKGTKWVKGKCFYGMGQHYWYKISNNMNCDDYFPAFLLYNGNKLNAFGWVTIGEFEGRYEHPGGSVLKLFFKPETMPSCVLELPHLSTMHIYLQKRGIFNFC